jgi:hypothetical protein
MIEIHHFNIFAFFSGDVAMIEQLRWIAQCRENWLSLIRLYSYRGYADVAQYCRPCALIRTKMSTTKICMTVYIGPHRTIGECVTPLQPCAVVLLTRRSAPSAPPPSLPSCSAHWRSQ